ncbi:tyrosine-type recombinase/integrase [Bacteriovoracaceae bacterium]|nr:tyrosine-type recombinase/integrase [Bacteriovoracaceae bacterium]
MAIHKYEENGKHLYRVHVKDRNAFGKQVNRKRKGISSEARAKRVELELKMELLKLKDLPAVLRWDEWVDECIRRMTLEFRNSTIMGYRRNLDKWVLPHFKNKLLDQIRKGDVHAVIFQGITGVSDETRRSILKQVKRIFNMAVEEGLINSNPAVGVKVKVAEKKKLCLNHEEVKILLHNAFNKSHPYYEIWAVAVMTGMRSGELNALLWSDIDFENNYISVNKSWSSKNGIGPTKSSLTRSISISSSLKKLLTEIKLKCTGTHVLPRPNSCIQGDQAKIIREFCNGLGITKIGFHDLRATFITQMLIKDVPLAKVMKIVGHANIKTTMKYLRMIAKDVEGATEALGIELPDYIEENNVVSLF